MRKILLSLFASSAIFYSVNAQTRISFETSEGYTLGTLEGQNGWTMWGDAIEKMVQVTTQSPTDGLNSFVLISDGNYTGDLMGVEKPITTFHNTEISFDIKLGALDGSDQSVDLYDSEYNSIASIYFSWDGMIVVSDGTAYQDVGTWQPDKVYNVKYNVNFNTNKVDYYLDGGLLLSAPIIGATSLDIIDFTTDNYASGYIVDNIQIKDRSLSTVENINNNAVTVYPNPTVDFVNIKTTEKILSMKVYDIGGKLVTSVMNGNKTINMSTLRRGTYLLKIQTDSGIYNKKIIKK